MAKITLRVVRKPNLMKKKKKQQKNTSISVKEITKASFETALPKKPSAHKTLDDDDDNNKGRINSSSWVKSLLLGSGAYGSVYLGTSKSKTHQTGERAIKTAELSHASSLMDEGRIMIRLQSPFIVRCYGDEIAREDCSTQYNLILEYCSGKTIADLIEDNHGELLESETKVFARDVLSGLTYIHDRNIIHCDIKPDNLLLSPTHVWFRSTGYLTKIGDFGLAMEKGSLEYGNGYGHKRGTTRYIAPELIGQGFVDFGVGYLTKIGDFGLAMEKGSVEYSNGYDHKRGTTSYMAPKLMAHGIVDFGSDVWAFGYTVLEMLSGISVWGEYGDLAFDDWVTLIGHSDRMPHVPALLSKEALDFLSRCLERDVNKRWSTHELKNHPFVLL
uniref:Protein kinase domain-containing protein n=1 Tax=Brassica oleracea var. oleracea TaxID=109376 RepID=A0A0D3DRJ3_BRAOL